MREQKNSSGGGIGFLGFLTLLFIALKLTGYIDWSWMWVLAPLWIGIPVMFAIALLVFILAVIVDVGSKHK